MKFISAITLIGFTLASSVSANSPAIKTHETEFASDRADLAQADLLQLFTAELASMNAKLAKQGIELAAMKADKEEQDRKLAAVRANNEEQETKFAIMKANNEEQDIELAAVKAELATVKLDLSPDEMAAALKSKFQLKNSAEDRIFSNPEKNHLRQLRKNSEEDEREDNPVDLAPAVKANENQRALAFPVNPINKLRSDLKLKSYYVYEKLDAGETRDVFVSGPVRIQASCGGGTSGTAPDFCSGNGDVCLGLTLNHDEDMLVFGDIAGDPAMDDSPIVQQTRVLPAGQEYKKAIWEISNAGNNKDDGAIWTSTGHYFGFDGDSLIGIQRDDGLEVVGGNCIITGVVNYVIPVIPPKSI